MKRPLSDKRPMGPFVEDIDTGNKGKGPLELPRLTNIGPLSETSEEVGDLIFRGGNIQSFNKDEFSDNTIDGRPVDIWILDTAAVVKRYNLDTETLIGTHKKSYFDPLAENTDAEQAIIDEFRIGEPETNEFGVDTGIEWVPIKSLVNNGLIARHTNHQVTGGISSNLGAAFRFAGTGGTSFEKDVPLVLFLEKNRIPARLTKVEYTERFINEHPELAGAADSGGRMVMAPTLTEDFELGEFSAWYGVGAKESKVSELRKQNKLLVDIQNDYLLLKWFDNPLDNFKSLEPEQELFAHTNEIDLDQSLFAVCFYTGPSRVEKLYRDSVGNPDGVSTRQQLKSVHKEVKKRMVSNSNRLVSCVFDTAPRTSDKRISRSQFKFLYDGEEFTDDYEYAVPFTDPTKF